MSKIVTIDGPVSSGKNSVGFALAQKLGYQFIDTGSIYRAGSLIVLRKKLDPSSKQQVSEVFNHLNISFKNVNGKFKIFLETEDVSSILHLPEVTNLVSTVAAYSRVRKNAKGIQRQVGLRQNTVMTGRDIGTEIFPDAQHKFFLTASPEVRAKRRFLQQQKERPQVSLSQVLIEIRKRDQQDSTRSASPMRIPKDAIIIDNSNLTVEQTVEKMLEYISPLA